MKLIFLFFIFNINTTDPFSWWWIPVIIIADALVDAFFDIAKEKVDTFEPKSMFNIRLKEMEKKRNQNKN
jgi:hypothetical protein